MKKEPIKKAKTSTKKVTEEKTVKSVEEKAETMEAVEPAEVKKEEEIMPPTEAELAAEELKKTYKEVFITEVADIQIVWRKLKRSEYKEAMSKQFSENADINYFERQEFMARKVILFPENIDELLEDYAGVSDIIATETMVKTGFGITTTKKA